MPLPSLEPALRHFRALWQLPLRAYLPSQSFCALRGVRLTCRSMASQHPTSQADQSSWKASAGSSRCRPHGPAPSSRLGPCRPAGCTSPAQLQRRASTAGRCLWARPPAAGQRRSLPLPSAALRSRTTTPRWLSMQARCTAAATVQPPRRYTILHACCTHRKTPIS